MQLHVLTCALPACRLLVLLAFDFRGLRAWALRGYRAALTAARAATAAKAAQCFAAKNGAHQVASSGERRAESGERRAALCCFALTG
jgi:hypothetical protein